MRMISIDRRNSIAISGAGQVARQTKTGSSRFAFVDEGFGKASQSIRFKIVTLKNWIGVGIGVREKLQGMDYRFECTLWVIQITTWATAAT